MLSLMGIAVVGLIVNTFSVSSTKGRFTQQTQSNIEKINEGLIAFVATNGYLPCPADGAQDTGLANPTTATTSCSSPDGTVPWKTLGIPEELA